MRIRKEFARLEGIKSSRLIVIAAEGRCTENIYFEAMKALLSASNVQVEVLKRDSNDSSPENVYNQIHEFITEYNIYDDDELWVVVDRDKWEMKMLKGVARYCIQNTNLHFCLSNPCFELWLLLHLEDVSRYGEEEKKRLSANRKNSKHGTTYLKKQLKALLGSYTESNYDAYSLLANINVAIDRAEILDINPKDRWPQTIGTRAHLLAKSIMGK